MITILISATFGGMALAGREALISMWIPKGTVLITAY